MGTLIKLMIMIVLITVPITYANIPGTLNYQGRLTDSAGDPVADGPYLIKFIIWDDAVLSDPANELWNSGFQTVQVQGGLFDVQLGESPMPALPVDLFSSGSTRYLGITISTDSEISPRTPITSVAYSYQALNADTSGYAKDIIDDCVTSSKLKANAVTSEKIADGEIGESDVNSNEVQLRIDNSCPPGFYIKQINADGTVLCDNDSVGGDGDITAVTASGGLIGGGYSGDVELAIATQGVTETKIANNAVTSAKINNYSVYDEDLSDNCVNSTKIQDGTIHNNDISPSANIQPSKISGTAATLGYDQTFTADNYFDDYVQFGDSTMKVNPDGITIGSTGSIQTDRLMHFDRNYNTGFYRYGINVNIKNAGTGHLYGINSRVNHTTDASGGEAYAVYGYARSDGDNRYGVYGHAITESAYNHTGYSYGVYGYAVDGEESYGVYGLGSSALTNYAGYFSGDVEITGGCSKGYGSFKIDHPLDPENKYLYHSFVESPDMMNVYNGNVTTNESGQAIVRLPDYFEALNKDFRYQLTVIGSFAQAIISEEISENQFVISTDKPYIKVSWQVTGIRKDPVAEVNRIQVEVEKPDREKGLYIHPEAYGFGEDKFIRYEMEQAAIRDAQEGGEK
jgi:hypothetical protein